MKEVIVKIMVRTLWCIGVIIGYVKWNVTELARVFKEVMYDIRYN